MAKTMCKVCWEMVDEAGPCPKKVCDKDFSSSGVTDTTGAGVDGLDADVLPAGAWSGSGASWELVQEGTGFKKVYAKCLLSFDSSKDVPGTNFQVVCPMQDHVNPDIVADKVAAFKKKAPGKHPVVPVVYNKKTGRVTINGDGHHTFVACLISKVPVMLYLYKVPFAGAHKDWTTCTYKKFTKNPAGATGTKFG